MISLAHNAPILATDCAKAVRAAGANIHLLQKPPYGFVLRCEFGSKQFRVVIRPLTRETAPDIPTEGASPFYLVDNLDGLRDWLESIKPEPAAV